MSLEVRILHRTDWTEVFRYLPRASAVRWHDPVAGPGYGEIRVSGGERNLTDGLNEFAMNNLVAIYDRGQRVFTFKIDRWRFEEVTDDEDAGQWMVVSGPGLKASLMHGLNYPTSYDHEHGIYRLAMDQRPFTFAALDYDETTDAWAAATVVAPYNNPPFIGVPPAWPDSSAAWISTALTVFVDDFADLPDAQIMYFRQTFNLTVNTTVTVFAAAAGVLEVYVDGEMVLETSKVWRIGEAEMRLPPGTHLIAARYRPFPDADDAGILITLGTQVGTTGGEPDYDWIVRTSNLWSVLGNVNPPPGFTPGRIVRLLVEEFLARCDFYGQPSLIASLTLDFTDDEDSNGDPWAERVDRYWQVGTDIMQILAEVCESAAESYITPEGVLKMYTTERGADLSDEVHFITGDNVKSLAYEMFAGLGNHVLGRYDAGWTEKHRQSVSPGGDLVLRREAFLSLGTADSSTEARRIMTTTLDNEARQRRVTTVEIVSDVGARPYVDFNVGDYVSAFDIYTQEMASQRVVSLSGHQDDDGNLVYVPELVLP